MNLLNWPYTRCVVVTPQRYAIKLAIMPCTLPLYIVSSSCTPHTYTYINVYMCVQRVNWKSTNKQLKWTHQNINAIVNLFFFLYFAMQTELFLDFFILIIWIESELIHNIWFIQLLRMLQNLSNDLEACVWNRIWLKMRQRIWAEIIKQTKEFNFKIYAW